MMDVDLATFVANDTLAATAVSAADKQLSKYRNHEYPLQFWWCLAALIGLLAVVHWTAVVLRRLLRLGKPPPFARAMMHAFRTVAFRLSIPYGVGGYAINVAEFLAACAYIVAVFTWEFINTTDLHGARFTLRYWTNRAGHLAAAQFPLLIGLGMKNNIISLLTGISYDKLNFLHRVIARVLCVLLWVHASGRVTEITEDFGEAWFRWGLVSTIALTLLAALSVRPLRSRGYEMFLVAHFFVGIILLVGAYIHTNNFNEATFIYPSFALYFLDRLLRFLRVFLFNGGYRRILRALSLSTKAPLSATVELISPTLVRIRVSGVPRWVRWAPGQVIYLSVPSVSKRTPWEAHPFSIANIDVDDDSFDSEGVEEKDSDEKSATASSSSQTHSDPVVESDSKELIFIVRARRGFTRRLVDFAGTTQSSVKLPVFIDGPYGIPAVVEGARSMLLFAGGSGVSYTLPILLDLLRTRTPPSSTCERVIAAFGDTLAAALSRHQSSSIPSIDIRIHLTNGSLSDVESVTVEKQDRRLGPLRRFEGRPDVGAIMREEVGGCGSGSLGIHVCGPTGLADDVRGALRRETSVLGVMQGEKPLVRLHVEKFGV
ncbi:hypothetical protein C8F01DRAFT_1147818 [Mycena amicta]|nr:hypothetical protein C8F01DRAFT_1147818 [Mycena amicta]